jgi:biotin carboxyl carrier protein
MARYTLIAPEVPTADGAHSAEHSIICDVHSLPGSTTAPQRDFEVHLDGVPSRATLLAAGPPWLFLLDGKPCEVVAEASGEYRVLGSGVTLRIATAKSKRVAATTTTPCLVAPMPGRVVRVLCQAGDLVEAGTPLVVLEAMKMENELVAPARGRVQEVFIQEGSTVEARAKLVTLAEP